MKVEFTLNGTKRSFEVAPEARLADVLRNDANLKGLKIGCSEGVCGACTILIDGRAVCSCQTFAGQAHGRDVVTIEGVGTLDKPHPLQQAFVAEHAVQCGYCTPGAVLAAKALLDKTPKPTSAQIVRALDGNLCRCTGYVKIVRAVERAAGTLEDER